MTYVHPVLGGMLIGLSISIMLLFNGRVTGVSGIIGGIIRGVLRTESSDLAWRIMFVAGLIVGGVGLSKLDPDYARSLSGQPWYWLVSAGLLVGFGTAMGGGCTSGHGICGISRLSLRSIVATVIFIGFGIISATAFRSLIGFSI
jgi:uncharacterized membrane protein YedE/YeeE